MQSGLDFKTLIFRGDVGDDNSGESRLGGNRIFEPITPVRLYGPVDAYLPPDCVPFTLRQFRAPGWES